jgi:hypothetical protein
VLIKLHDSATYDDRRKSYEWLMHQAFKMQVISLKVYFLRNQSNETVHFLFRDGQFYSARFIGGGNRVP